MDHERATSANNSQTESLSTSQNNVAMRDIQMYERRIQNLIDGVGVLKERVSRDDEQLRKHANPVLDA